MFLYLLIFKRNKFLVWTECLFSCAHTTHTHTHNHTHTSLQQKTQIAITNFIIVITIHLLSITWNPVLLQAELFKKMDDCLLANCRSSFITIKDFLYLKWLYKQWIMTWSLWRRVHWWNGRITTTYWPFTS